MSFEEFIKEYKENSELYEDKELFIVDYRKNYGKVQRHIRPTKVKIFGNNELPAKKVVHYSDYHFKEIGKKGQKLKKIIAPYDNTGYRSYTGVGLNVFLTEEEAIAKYNEQIDNIREYHLNEIIEQNKLLYELERMKL